MTRVLGVIGGSGIYDIPGLTEVEELRAETPYGAPSDALIRGRLGETTLLFLPRHGRGHRLPPHGVNYRANICALKRLGAEQVVSLSAVGSMKDDILPGSVVIVDQYIDLTRRRVSSFFEEGLVAHVGFAEPVCAKLARAALAAARRAGATAHAGGTYVCMEGPQFSTRAESHLYRSWGASVIGMTAMPEAKLAREAELPYATIALPTDYDAWHATEQAVTVDAVLAVLRANAALARRIVAELAGALPDPIASPASSALDDALITPHDSMDAEARARLAWLLDARPRRNHP
ncbi:MAG: S-methyl-5'-thioadenosine phosphorylase [Sorangiineae bacterium]|nr:S-methyl-5'-thioadenosine phosphorylase [Polyangiaceae bacterium]MEB2322288.1 S-methyl-5'-thioadenosine phosphorylase [Sorangiineae bacterium]